MTVEGPDLPPSPEAPEASPGPAPDIDHRGVDRAQIRRMLGLTVQERLLWLEEFVRDVAEIRRLNEKHPVR